MTLKHVLAPQLLPLLLLLLALCVLLAHVSTAMQSAQEVTAEVDKLRSMIVWDARAQDKFEHRDNSTRPDDCPASIVADREIKNMHSNISLALPGVAFSRMMNIAITAANRVTRGMKEANIPAENITNLMNNVLSSNYDYYDVMANSLRNSDLANSRLLLDDMEIGKKTIQLVNSMTYSIAPDEESAKKMSFSAAELLNQIRVYTQRSGDSNSVMVYVAKAYKLFWEKHREKFSIIDYFVKAVDGSDFGRNYMHAIKFAFMSNDLPAFNKIESEAKKEPYFIADFLNYELNKLKKKLNQIESLNSMFKKTVYHRIVLDDITVWFMNNFRLKLRDMVTDCDSRYIPGNDNLIDDSAEVFSETNYIPHG